MLCSFQKVRSARTQKKNANRKGFRISTQILLTSHLKTVTLKLLWSDSTGGAPARPCKIALAVAREGARSADREVVQWWCHYSQSSAHAWWHRTSSQHIWRFSRLLFNTDEICTGYHSPERNIVILLRRTCYCVQKLSGWLEILSQEKWTQSDCCYFYKIFNFKN